MPDLTGTLQSVTFLSGAEQRRAFIAAWLNMCGLDVTKATDGVHRDSNYDPDEFPGKSGTYEYVVQALRSTRAS